MLLGTATPAAAHAKGECRGATSAALNAKTVAGFADGVQTRTFRLEIPSGGLLDLETTDRGAGTEPTVAFLGTSCQTSSVSEHAFRRHQLLEIARAGSYYVAVTASSPVAGGDFALRVGFAPHLDQAAVAVAGSQLGAVTPRPDAKGNDLDELILDPGGTYIWYATELRFSLKNPFGENRRALGEPDSVPAAQPGSKGNDLDELILDPGGTFIYLPEMWRFSLAKSASGRSDSGVVDWSVRYAPVAVCPVDVKDHGDSLACATELALGSRLDGTIEAAVDPDQDVFAFIIEQRSTIVLETSGEIAATGELLDARGGRLVEEHGAAGAGLRIETILEPGRYYLRVGAQPGSAGAYQLRVAAAAQGE